MAADLPKAGSIRSDNLAEAEDAECESLVCASAGQVKSYKEKKYMDNASRRNTGLDLLKLLSAFLVVVIHYPPETANSELLVAFCRVAVPIFLMINGFFWQKVSSDIYKGIIRIKKLLVLTGICVLVYTLYDVALHLLDRTYSGAITLLAEWKYNFMPIRIVTFLFFNDSCAASHCWYMLALVYTYVIVMFFHKIGKSEQLYKYAPLLAVAHYVIRLTAEYVIPEYNYSYFYRNWLFMALPFFSMGVLIGRAYKNKEEWFVSKRKVFFIATLLLLPLYFIEVQVTAKVFSEYFEVYLSTIALSLLLFLIGLTNDANATPLRLLSLWSRRFSTSIYCNHFMAGSIISLTIGLFIKNLSEAYGLLKPVVVFVASLLIAAVYEKIKEFTGKHLSH